MISSNGVPIAPQALAETTPFLTNGFWYGTDGIDLTAMYATYAAIYSSQPAVAAVVNKVAASVARLSFHVWDTSDPANKKLDLTSDYAKLMAKPCPIMSPYKFWEWISSTYEIYGEAYILKVRDDQGVVRELMPMHPTRTAVKRNPLGVETFVFTVGVASAGILTADQADVIPLRRYNPNNVMRGLSRLEPLRVTVLNIDAIQRATTSWWQRAGRPSVALTTPGTLSAGAAERLKAKWDSSQAGPDKMGGTVVLENGLTPQIMQLSAEEMQYIESRKMNQGDVCMVYDVSPPAVHVLDEANFASITELMRSLYRDTMAPRLEDFESQLDFYLRPEFDIDPNLYGSFALDEVLRGDFETRAETAVKLVTNGIMKPSEARPLFDLPEAESVADVLYANAATVPLGTMADSLRLPSSASDAVALEPEEVPPTPALPPPVSEQSDAGAPLGSNDRPMADGQANEEKKVLKFDSRSMMGRLGRTIKSGNVVALRSQLVSEGEKSMQRVVIHMKLDALARTSMKSASILMSGTYAVAMGAAIADFTHATVHAAGTQVANQFDGKYNPAGMTNYINTGSTNAGEDFSNYVTDSFNASWDNYDSESDTASNDYVSNYFDTVIASFVTRFVDSRVTNYMSQGSMDAARQNNVTSKTWNAGGGKDPRAEHSGMNGETVDLDTDFSNGLRWPGDSSAGADENANCSCYLTFYREPTGVTD